MFRSQVNNHSSIWFPVTLSTKSNQIRAMQGRNSAAENFAVTSGWAGNPRGFDDTTRPPRQSHHGSWSDYGVLVIEQTRQPLPHVARFVEMIGHAYCAPAHGERKTAQIGHQGEHRFVS